MGRVTVVNDTPSEVQVRITACRDDGNEDFFTVPGNGGRDTWGRNHKQVLYYITNQGPGTPIQSILAVPDTEVHIK
jgi:hypothetical protein